MAECTFQPEKTAMIEYEYAEEFSDPAQRLYNNFFEREMKKKII